MTDAKTTAEEVKEAEARVAMAHLTGALASMDAITGDLKVDPTRAADAMEDDVLAGAVAIVQHIRQRLAQQEHELTTALGKRLGRTVGYLPDGRQFKVERSADRKEWDHDSWKHDARRAVVSHHAGARVVLDTDTGEETPLAKVLMEAITEVQEVHGSTSPRVTNLRALGLVTTDYCTSTPGAWRLNVVKPTEKKDTTDA